MQPSAEATQYEKVFAYLRDEIVRGQIASGTRLPGERRLAEQLGVSRETLRQGLRLAEDAGLIVRKPARGTFVAEPQIVQELARMQAFDLTLRGAQLTPTYSAVEVTERPAEVEEAEALAIGYGDSVVVVDAIGTGDGRPLARYRSVLPDHVAQRLPETPDWRSRASYQVVAAALGVEQLIVEQQWEALTLPPSVAAALATEPGAAAFRSTSIFRGVDATALELRTAWYPGSRYQFTITRMLTLPEGPDAHFGGSELPQKDRP